MDKGFTTVLNLLWPPCAAKRDKSTIGKQLDAEKNVRAEARIFTESILVDALPFRVEGLVDTISFKVGEKSYVAAQELPVSTLVAADALRVHTQSSPTFSA